MQLTLEVELEDDGRWLAEVPQLPGVLAYGASASEAMSQGGSVGFACPRRANRAWRSRTCSHQFRAARCCVSHWRSVRARVLLQALLQMGWQVKRQSGSHRTLSRIDFRDFVFAFHDSEEIGPRMWARGAKHTGLEPGDL